MTRARAIGGAVVVCPHCGTTVPAADIEGRSSDLYAAMRLRSEALWRAIRSLEDRAASSRWALRNDVSQIRRFGESLEDSIRRDEEMAAHLREYVATVDATLVETTPH